MTKISDWTFLHVMIKIDSAAVHEDILLTTVAMNVTVQENLQENTEPIQPIHSSSIKLTSLTISM